jgi:hypothetical protein
MGNRKINQNKTSWIQKLILRIKVETIISLFALSVASYTLWDNTFRAKIDVSSGKQIDLYVGSIEYSPLQPIIHMNIEFVNSGGKTAFIDDIKLVVSFRSKDKLPFKRDFVTVREIKNSIIDIDGISGVNRGITEVSPIVIIGRTSVLKKYVFFPSEQISQSQIPLEFDLEIKIFIKQSGDWIYKKEFSISNNKDIWLDLDSIIHKSSIRDIELKY